MNNIFEEVALHGGCRVIGFAGDSLGTSSINPDDFEGNAIAYSCRALRLFNPNSDKTLYYSFDDTHWFTVPPLGEQQIVRSFDILYLKSDDTDDGALYEGEVARIQ